MLNTKYLKDYAKAKLAPGDVKQTKVTLFKATVIGREARMQHELSSPETKR